MREKNRVFSASHGISPVQPGALAIDLGAGSGFQALPLAVAGYAVQAIDQCAALLQEAPFGDRPYSRFGASAQL